ncbi:MAG: radical SAM protein [Pseudomonadota bacterium]
MKIALINPKGTFFSKNEKYKKFWNNVRDADKHTVLSTRLDFWSGFSLGLLIIAALTPEEHEISLIDENIEQVDFKEKYDLVCISAITQTATRAYYLADKFRQRDCKVIVGGIHPTLMPEEAVEHADSVVIGEVETIWSTVLKDVEDGRLKRCYKSASYFNLRNSPVPRYDLLDIEHYKMVWIQTSRGCPHDCEFCAASKVFGLKYRHKSIDQVMREIDYVIDTWGNYQINFADDNIFFNKKYANDLLDRIEPLKIRWAASTDVSVGYDEKFLEKLRRSGCTILLIGFESINEDNLKGLSKNDWKRRRVKDYPMLIQRIQSHGIGIMGAFLVGFDNDKSSVFNDVANFILDTNLYASQITVPTPLPGTRLRERLTAEKRLLESSWDKYTFLDVNYAPKHLTIDELEAGVLDIYMRVYNKEARLSVARHFKQIFSDMAKVQSKSNDQLAPRT